MLRHYELTDQEWEQVAPFLPPQNTGKPVRPPKNNRQMPNTMASLAHNGASWRGYP